jgi:tetratricopeptide (TPR) repeat protein
MKKLVLTVTAIALMLANTDIYAQAGKVMTATNYLNDYKSSNNAENLVKAKEAIDAATQHESTSMLGKTWYNSGLIHIFMFNDANLGSGKNNYAETAFNAFKTSISLEDKKFRDQEMALTYTKALSADVFNRAVDSYQAKKHDEAYRYFMLTMDINSFLQNNNSDVVVTSVQALSSAASAAEAAGMDREAKLAYEELTKIDPQAIYYRLLANMYKEEGKLDKALEVLSRGSASFPDDADIIIDQLNIYIGQDKLTEAIDIIDKAIKLQPKNDMLYYVKGTAFDAAKKMDEALAAYNKAIEINPKNVRALYNAGAMYFNGANVYIEQMNSLGLSAADQKKYDELDKKRKDLYSKAKPYFEKVLELEPEDDGALRALNRIKSTLK